MELDSVKLITDYGFSIAAVVYLVYQMRIDRADALRREAAYTEALREDRAKQEQLMREIVESNVRMERIVHELKNVLQQYVYDNRRALTPREPQGND